MSPEGRFHPFRYPGGVLQGIVRRDKIHMSQKLRECAALKPFYMESEDEFLLDKGMHLFQLVTFDAMMSEG